MRVIMLSFLMLLTGLSYAQQQSTFNSVEPYQIEVTNSKTTNIIFASAIVSVDRGTTDVLVQKAAGVENILQVKAGRENFKETNISVVTADGSLTSILVKFSADPQVLNHSLKGAGKSKANTITLSPEYVNEAEVKAFADAAGRYDKSIRGKRDEKHQIRFHLDGIFINNNVLYYRLQITNYSNVNYRVGQLRFFVRDKRKSKRTATQEVEVVPIKTFGFADQVDANTTSVLIYAMPLFTIPDGKELVIQLMEDHGGRHLSVRVSNRLIVGATIL